MKKNECGNGKVNPGLGARSLCDFLRTTEFFTSGDAGSEAFIHPH